MALNKEIITDNGAVARYHRVDRVILDNSHLLFHVTSYVSEVYRALEKPVDSYYYDCEITLEEEESMGIRQLCYTKMKEMDQWADATDC